MVTVHKVARLAAPSAARHSAAYRDIVVPSHARHVTLRFAYRMPNRPVRSGRSGRASSQGLLEVDLLNLHSGRLLARVLRANPVAASTGRSHGASAWRHASYDLTRYRGHSLRLLVRMHALNNAAVDLSGARITAR